MRRILFLLSTWIVALTTVQAGVRDTITADRATPLIGNGCVINQIDKNLVDVVASTTELNYFVDTNPNNYASFRAVAGVTLLYNPILSVKDMNRMFLASSNSMTHH